MTHPKRHWPYAYQVGPQSFKEGLLAQAKFSKIVAHGNALVVTDFSKFEQQVFAAYLAKLKDSPAMPKRNLTTTVAGLQVSFVANILPAEPDVGIMGPYCDGVDEVWVEGKSGAQRLDPDELAVPRRLVCPVLAVAGAAVNYHHSRDCPLCRGTGLVDGWVSLRDHLELVALELEEG